MIRRMFGFLAWVACLLAPSAVLADTIARAALVVGQAQRLDATGRSRPLELGTLIAVNDRIITGPDGLAILVFSDEGRISLRPDSELWIRDYRVDPSGRDSHMELELVRGTMRQISGKAARSQPERYRLNTPIAALGVRGTDFLARSTGGNLETLVVEGSIVLYGNADRCRGADCAPLIVLNAQGPERYLRVAGDGSFQSRVLGSDEIERVFGLNVARQRAPTLVAQHAGRRGDATNSARNTGATPETAAVAGNTAIAVTAVELSPSIGTPGWNGVEMSVASTLADLSRGSTDIPTVPAAPPPSGPQLPPAPQLPPPPEVPPAPQLPSPPEVPPAPQLPSPPAVPPAPQLPTQLVWGRFDGAQDFASALLQPYAQASEGRHVTVGQLGQYALWRAGAPGTLDKGLRGQASFVLAAGDAIFDAKGQGVSAAQITSGSLGVDFDRARFQAALGLNHPATGAVSVSASGRINDEGIFNGGDATQRVAGALSRDGREAGMLFQRLHDLGTFRGITLWNGP